MYRGIMDPDNPHTGWMAQTLDPFLSTINSKQVTIKVEHIHSYYAKHKDMHQT